MGKKPDTPVLPETMEKGKDPNSAIGEAGNKTQSSLPMGKHPKGVLANGTYSYPYPRFKQCLFKGSRVCKSKRHYNPAENC